MMLRVRGSHAPIGGGGLSDTPAGTAWVRPAGGRRSNGCQPWILWPVRSFEDLQQTGLTGTTHFATWEAN